MKPAYQKEWMTCLLALAISVLPLTACSKEPSKGQPVQGDYSLRIGATGMPEVLDAKGRLVKGHEVKPPVEAKNILNVKTFTVMEVQGSHFILFSINGTLYRYDLPHY
jgi:hypothetical protein